MKIRAKINEVENESKIEGLRSQKWDTEGQILHGFSKMRDPRYK